LLDVNGIAAKPSELSWAAQGDSSVTGKRYIHASYGKYRNVLNALGVGEASGLDELQSTGCIDQFAQSIGFEQDPVRPLVFTNPNGQTITNDGTAPFSWQMHDPKGEVLQKIQVQGTPGIWIEMTTDEWEQFKNAQPERAYLITHPVSGEPQLIRYKDFEALLRTGEWTLEYTGYRLMRKKNT
jgi:hypothetical protein